MNSRRSGGERQAKTVESVHWDKRLSLGARVTFVELAFWAKAGDGTVSRGLRALAAGVNVSVGAVRKYLAELEEAGHVDVARNGNRRCWYVLKSEAYWKAPARKRKAA